MDGTDTLVKYLQEAYPGRWYKLDDYTQRHAIDKIQNAIDSILDIFEEQGGDSGE